MKIDDLFLKKEELPILHETCFQIPIHSRLLTEDLREYEDLAKDIFPEVAEDWYNDLRKYVKTEKLEEETSEHIQKVYLNKKPKITKELHRQFVNGIWEDNTWTRGNGFVSGFSINRNAGGSLYLNEDDENCRSFGNRYIKFSEEKQKEFEYEKIGTYSKMLAYASHNIDSYPGALFLRNWAMRYMNEIFKEIF